MENEEQWEKWWASLDSPRQQAVIILAEMRAAAKEPLDYAVAFKASKLSETEWHRVKGYEVWEQPGFEVWLAGKATLVDEVSGHIRLAVACTELWRENDYARQWGVFHAGASGDSGVKDMIWERQGRRWEWMASHPGGFVVAGRELVALGRERVGRVLMQNGGYGETQVAFDLALHGGAEMEGEVRDVIGIEPYGGGMFDEALEVRFVGHRGTVCCVADAGGGKIVTGGSDRTLKEWDVYSGKCLTTLEGHTRDVSAVVLVGGRVISGSYDGTLRVWDVESGECKQVTEHDEDDEVVLGLCMADERTIVSCGAKGAVFVWKIGEGGQLKKEKELEGHANDVYHVIALVGGRVASGGKDGVILVHDMESGDVIGKLEGHTSWVNDLAVLADGRLVSASYDETLRVWSSDYIGEAETVLEGHESSVMAVTVLENGMIVSGDASGWLRRWSEEGSSWKALGEIEAPTGNIWGLHALDGCRLVSVGADQHVGVWNAPQFDGEKQQRGHKSSMTVGAVLSDGRVASGGVMGEVVIWKSAEREKVAVVEQVIEGYRTFVMGLVATSNGFAWCDVLGHTFLWEARGNRHVRLDIRCNRLRSVGGGSILVCLNGGQVHVYDVEDKELKTTLELAMTLFCIEPLDSKRVAVGGVNGRVYVVNVANGTIEKTQLIGSSDLWSIVSVGDGKMFIANKSQELWLWDKEEAPEKVLELKTWVYSSVSDSKVILRTTDGEMIVWNWKKKERDAEFGGLSGTDVAYVAWDASRRLAVFFMKMERSWIAYEL